MNIRNLTPHPVTLVAEDGTHTTYPVDPDGPARVSQLPAALLPGWWTAHIAGPVEDASPVPCPVYASGGYGPLEGLPESIEPGDTLIVSLFAAQAGAVEAAATRRALQTGTWADGSPLLLEERPAAEQRLKVLSRLVCPGTGPQDKPVRNDAGQVVAVTRLVRP